MTITITQKTTDTLTDKLGFKNSTLFCKLAMQWAGRLGIEDTALEVWEASNGAFLVAPAVADDAELVMESMGHQQSVKATKQTAAFALSTFATSHLLEMAYRQNVPSDNPAVQALYENYDLIRDAAYHESVNEEQRSVYFKLTD